MSDNNNDGMNAALRAVAAEGSTSSGVFVFGDTDTDTATDTDNAAVNDALRALASGGTISLTVTLGTAEDPENNGPKRRPAQSDAEMSAWFRGEARRQMSSALEQAVALRDANRD